MAGLNTPMMRQYRELKAAHADCILLFRAGDFYEMFGEDAVEAAEILQITLTSRDKRAADPLPMCGIPYHAFQQYVDKLTAAGRKVAIAEQIAEDAGHESASRSGKPLMRREVRQVISPGTTLSAGLIEADRHHFLVALNPPLLEKTSPETNLTTNAAETHPRRQQRRSLRNAPHRTVEVPIGVALMDVSTGQFEVAEVPHRTALLTLLAKLQPREILLPEASSVAQNEALKDLQYAIDTHGPLTSGTRPTLSQFDQAWLAPARAHQSLLRQLQTQNLSGFGVEHLPYALAAAGALLDYLQSMHQGTLQHVTRLRPRPLDEGMFLDEITLEHLEVFGRQPAGQQNTARHHHGRHHHGRRNTARRAEPAYSLYALLNRCMTPMGARLLREWLQQPLCEAEAIEARLEALEAFAHDTERRELLQTSFRAMRDVERTLARLSMPSGGIAELLHLRTALSAWKALPELLLGWPSRRIEELQEAFDPLPEVLAVLEERIADEPGLKLAEGGYIRRGFSAELDELWKLKEGSAQILTQLEWDERESTQIASLKVRYNRVFGYYIEIPRTQLNKVPAHYLRRQTLTQAERYTLPRLQELEEQILSAADEIGTLEQRLFLELRAIVLGYTRKIQHSVGILAELDVLMALAEVAQNHDYTRPRFPDEYRRPPCLRIEEGRHPVLEQLDPEKLFVPNDVLLDARRQQILLITGPNMAGKSTVMRQVALIQLMAQIGSFVPARQAHLPLCDRIFTRVGASDEITRGRSTFMVEMNETANILNNATARSLILLDEIGRGTSTYDGMSLAWAIVEHLHQVGALTLFATHYHELNHLAETWERVCSFSVGIKEEGTRLVFTHHLRPGPATRSYGIHVARLAGLPSTVLRRAETVLAQLSNAAATLEAQAARTATEVQPSLFDPVSQTPGSEAPGIVSLGSASPGGISPVLAPLPPHAPLENASLADATPSPPRTPAEDEVLEELGELDLDRLTPLQALQQLVRLQRSLHEGTSHEGTLREGILRDGS